MNKKEIVSTKNAPAAIGPYSQAIICNGFMYLSGQIPLNPETGEVVEGDITKQTKRVLENIKAILIEKGLDFNAIIKTTIFVTDINNFATINNIYGEYFKENPPARSTVEISSLPKGVNIEIEAIAVL